MKTNIKFNYAQLRDKILGCWIGKNIGGTIGAPYEGSRCIHDVKGFNSIKGEPLPNDDLDLQLVWLHAVKEVGIKSISANVLADYWMSYVPPHWNEYGIAKANLAMGILPPLSGEINNDEWKRSNGAWIRSEIWACLSPGVPNVAAKYAIMDACVDHGLSEGTYAEIFTATLESLAFFEKDVRTVVEKGLTFIPSDSRVAKSVQLVLDGYDNKKSWQEVREDIVKYSEDLGWFQAPANVSYTVLGLIYGEGDFKKSVIYATNCGDDTDCTAATCGAILGILMGAEGLPQDWKEYIGDRIVQICINPIYRGFIPKTCTELTDRVIETIPEVLNAHGIGVEFTDGESELNTEELDSILKGHTKEVMARSPYSFEVLSASHTDVLVEYEKEPKIKPLTELDVKLTLTNKRGNPRHGLIEVILPEGWTADYNRALYMSHGMTGIAEKAAKCNIKINVGENVDAINEILVKISFTPTQVMPVIVPLTLLG